MHRGMLEIVLFTTSKKPFTIKHLVPAITLLLASFFFTSVTAQNWYNPGETYVFQSLSGHDYGQAVQVQIVFDSAGVATVSQSYHTGSGTDQIRGYFRGRQGDWSFSDNTLSIPGNAPSYFLLTLDDLRVYAINGGAISLHCACKAGTDEEATCEVSLVVAEGGHHLSLACRSALGCSSCIKPVVSSTGLGDFSQGFLIMQATSVVIE